MSLQSMLGSKVQVFVAGCKGAANCDGFEGPVVLVAVCYTAACQTALHLELTLPLTAAWPV
jgi:hypothetical protein